MTHGDVRDIAASIATLAPATQSERARLWAEAGLDRLESDPTAATQIITELESITDERGFEVGHAWAQVVRAWRHIKAGEEHRGAAELRLAIAAFESHGEKRGAIRALNGLGVVYRYTGLLDRALDILKRAQDMAENLRWDELVCAIISNIGLVHLDLNDWDEAVRCLEAASRSGFNAEKNRPVTDSHLAIAYAELGRSAEADALIAGALDSCRRNGFKITEADVLGKSASILECAGAHEEAVRAYDRSLAIASEVGNRRLMAEHGIARSAILARLGRPEDAKAGLLGAIGLARDAGMKLLEASALSGLARTLATLGDWESAYSACQEAASLEKTLFGDKVAGQAATFKAERESAQSAAYKDELKRLSLISEIGMAVTSATDAESVGKILYERVSSLIPIDVFGLALYDAVTATLDFRYFIEDAQRVEPFVLPVDADDSLAGVCARSAEAVLIDDVEKDLQRYVKRARQAGAATGAPIRSLIYHPVLVKGSVVALISVQSRRVAAYAAHHVQIVKALAAYAGVALENARLFSEIKSIAGTDPLTGTLNRRRLMEVFSSELLRVKRYCGKLGVIIFDLDKFKAVNDRHGHAAGDAVLKEAARRCAESLRANDYLARFGGEEFIVLLPCTSLAGTMVVAERTRRAFAESPLELADGERIVFTASFGCAGLCAGDDLDSLTARADKALYRAKDSGRNQVASETLPGVAEGIAASADPRAGLFAAPGAKG